MTIDNVGLTMFLLEIHLLTKINGHQNCLMRRKGLIYRDQLLEVTQAGYTILIIYFLQNNNSLGVLEG
jgi:hypothetical protein